jgi:hypothetical protein
MESVWLFWVFSDELQLQVEHDKILCMLVAIFGVLSRSEMLGRVFFFGVLGNWSHF